jgi:DNA-binding LacI/PurR family transcriptional regulator
MERATIKDVAKRAGVSWMTVSRVLRGHSNHVPETQAKVLQAAKALDYKPNAMAQGFRTKKTGIIGFLVKQNNVCSVPADMFYAGIIKGVESELLESGYNVLLSSLRVSEIANLELPSILTRGYVEGLIVLGFSDQKYLEMLYEHCPNLVVVDESPENVPCVCTANYEGGQLVGEYLWSQGHRKFAVITSEGKNTNFDLRLAGFKDAIAAKMGTMVTFPICKGDAWRDGGKDAANQLITDYKNDFSAVFCANDHLAIYAIKAFQEAGLRVPEDISVMGFDDIDISAYINPPLTTLAVSKELMGRQAVKLMTGLIKKTTDQTRIAISPQLTRRGSVLQCMK